MTAINFPGSPSNGQSYSVGGRSWTKTSKGWKATAPIENLAAQVAASLVSTAPSTLDTLDELAAALGDDANFASTVTTALGTKQAKVSGVSDTEISYLGGAFPVTSSIQTQINGKAAVSHAHDGSAITYTINDKSANYTIIASDEGKLLRSTGSAITITIADVFAIGEVVTFTQYGAGQVTFAPAGGVTLHSVDSKRKTNKQYSTVQIVKTAASTYLLFGDIAA